MLENLSISKAVQFAIKVEEKGAEFYNDLALRFADNKELSDMFAALSADEQHHEKQFAALRDMVESSGAQTREPVNNDYLEAMALAQFFAINAGPFRGIAKVKNREDALEKVFAFEKAALGYFQAMQEVIGDNPILKALIATEKQHVVTVAKVMMTDSKFRSLGDNW